MSPLPGVRNARHSPSSIHRDNMLQNRSEAHKSLADFLLPMTRRAGRRKADQKIETAKLRVGIEGYLCGYPIATQGDTLE